MDLRNIETFVCVAENKSFTKAAEELNYAQSTVSMQIRQLEKELGYPLFDRIGKTVSMTAMGEAFLRHAYEIMKTVDQAKALDKTAAELQGTLRIGVLESLLFGTMLELLPKFRQAYPLVDLQLRMGQTTELIQLLKENQVDLVYLSAGKNTDEDLRCCYLRREELVFLCAPDHPARQERALQGLWQYDFLVTERSGICYDRLQKLAADCGCALRACVEVDSTIAIARSACKGLGLAFLPKYSVGQQLKEGSLLQLRTDAPPQYYYSQILCHKSRWLSPFMEGMIAMIAEHRP